MGLGLFRLGNLPVKATREKAQPHLGENFAANSQPPIPHRHVRQHINTTKFDTHWLLLLWNTGQLRVAFLHRRVVRSAHS
jgi:hypothetical protein